MLPSKITETDVIVVGGGIVGASLAMGLNRAGKSVALLDEGDTAFRASRGNFALIWAQSKGLNFAPYASWTQRSTREWHQLSKILKDETGIDVGHRQPGGFTLCLSEKEVDARLSKLKAFHAQPDSPHFDYEIIDHDEVRRRLPYIGKSVVGAVYSPLDGHANPLLLMRALQAYLVLHGGYYLPLHPVETITSEQDGFRVKGRWGEMRAEKLVLAAGLDNKRLAPMVGLEAPVRPNRGQIIVTEKAAPFLNNPMVTIRQTIEGSILIGDSQEEKGFENVTNNGVLSVMADRAIQMFPRLKDLNVVRTWSALRVLTPDRFPVYDETTEGPSAFVACCHSGVTLAGVHSMTLGATMASGVPFSDEIKPFSPRRFHVHSN